MTLPCARRRVPRPGHDRGPAGAPPPGSGARADPTGGSGGAVDAPQRGFDEKYEGLLDVAAAAGVAEHDGDVGGDRERLSDLAGMMGGDPVEEVDGDDERHAEMLEVVDGGEAVVKAAGVDEDDTADGTPHQLVP